MEVNSVLIIRINAYGELFNTRGVAAAVRGRFPAAKVVALTTPESEGRTLLEGDARLDGVLLFPPAGAARKSPSAFRAFLRRQHFDAVVACLGATPGLDYTRALLSLLLCPGRKFIADGGQDIVPAFSRRGLGIMASVVSSALRVQGGRRLAQGVSRIKTMLSTRAGRHHAHGDLTGEMVARLLWIRVDGLGDVMMMLPALAALRARYPQAQIDLLVRPLSVPLVQGLPGIGHVYTYEPGDAPLSTRSRGRQSLLSLARQLRKNRYDLAVDVAGRDVARLLAWASGARRRVAPAQSIYDTPGRGNLSFLMTDAVPIGLDRARLAVDNFLELMRRLGVPVPDAPYRLPVGAAPAEQVREKLATLGVTGPFAVIHAKSSEEMRDWRPERFARVADHLVERHGLSVVLCGAGRDRENNQVILAASCAGRPIVDATGVFALEELPALLASARLMVTVDTGPAHIAAMVGTPVVTLMLPCYHYNRPYGQSDGVVKYPDDVTGLDAHPFAGLVSAHFWEGGLLDYITAEDVCAVVNAKLAASAAPLRRAA